MRIPVFSSNGGTGLLNDLKLRIVFQNNTATQVLRQAFPSLQTDASGGLVIEQQGGSSTGDAAAKYIQSVELDSPTLTIILAAIAGTFLVLLWLVIRKK